MPGKLRAGAANAVECLPQLSTREGDALSQLLQQDRDQRSPEVPWEGSCKIGRLLWRRIGLIRIP
jgi:hypothetical protein